jgi:hypothetical protein
MLKYLYRLVDNDSSGKMVKKAKAKKTRTRKTKAKKPRTRKTKAKKPKIAKAETGKARTKMKKTEKGALYICDSCGCEIVCTTGGKSALICCDEIMCCY